MWCSKILVAYDGSAPSKAALVKATEIARLDASAEVLLVHVVRLYASGTEAAGISTVVAENAQAVSRELEEIAATLANPTSIKLLKGTSPADLIVRCAIEEDCDLIIMGSRGQGGVKGYLGSVSYAVVKESPVSVLIEKEAGAR